MLQRFLNPNCKIDSWAPADDIKVIAKLTRLAKLCSPAHSVLEARNGNWMVEPVPADRVDPRLFGDAVEPIIRNAVREADFLNLKTMTKNRLLAYNAPALNTAVSILRQPLWILTPVTQGGVAAAQMVTLGAVGKASYNELGQKLSSDPALLLNHWNEARKLAVQLARLLEPSGPYSELECRVFRSRLAIGKPMDPNMFDRFLNSSGPLHSYGLGLDQFVISAVTTAQDSLGGKFPVFAQKVLAIYGKNASPVLRDFVSRMTSDAISDSEFRAINRFSRPAEMTDSPFWNLAGASPDPDRSA